MPKPDSRDRVAEAIEAADDPRKRRRRPGAEAAKKCVLDASET
jgi:hypothetical protein